MTGLLFLQAEWDAFDVLTPDGIRVEMKTSAYLQAWSQRTLSRIVFSGLRRRAWNDEGERALDPTLNADVYVFCLQTSQVHSAYEILNVEQWVFYVLDRELLEQHGASTISLSSLKALADPIGFEGLSAAIRLAGDTRGPTSPAS